MKGFFWKLCAAFVLFVTLTFVGCEVNRGAYDACREGMSTKDEVKGKMHMEPWLESPDTLVYMGDNVTKVQFDFDDKGVLKSKQWIDKIK